jgi:hypothetical protein
MAVYKPYEETDLGFPPLVYHSLSLGDIEGRYVGRYVGSELGSSDWLLLGTTDGSPVGVSVGSCEGNLLGVGLGNLLGVTDGASLNCVDCSVSKVLGRCEEGELLGNGEGISLRYVSRKRARDRRTSTWNA